MAIGVLEIKPLNALKLTHNELLVICKERIKKHKDAANEQILLSYRTALFTVLALRGKLPEIKDILISDEPAQNKEQTADEMLAVVRAWNAALGGKENGLEGTQRRASFACLN